MTSNSSYSSLPDDDEEEQQSVGQKSNIDSIDYSLDAIENQLSSIALNTSVDDEETPSVANDHHESVMEIVDRSSTEIESERPCSSSNGGDVSASGADDNHKTRNDNHSGGNEGEVLDSVQSQWIPGKRHVNEDDTSMSWRERKKHFFVLSHSGKPIFSRYGDEHKLAGFSATLQAIISFVEDGGDRVKLVRAGKHQVVFLVKEQIYLVCISCTEEPYESLRGQLEHLYGQMMLILTKSVNRCFEKNAKFDMTPLLGGTDAVFSSLFHCFSWNPATFLHAYTCLPLPYATRQAAGAILQDVADSGVLFAMLMCKYKVVSLVGAQKVSLHPDDMLLLANFVMSSESFRTSESFSPICLPRYNPMAFLHAYVHYFDVDTYLVLLTSRSDDFFYLKDCRIRIENVLLKSNVLSEIQRSLLEGGMRVENLPVYPSTHSGSLFNLNDPKLVTGTQERLDETVLGIGGPAGLWHFIYRSMYLDQYVSSEFSSPISGHQQQKRSVHVGARDEAAAWLPPDCDQDVKFSKHSAIFLRSSAGCGIIAGCNQLQNFHFSHSVAPNLLYSSLVPDLWSGLYRAYQKLYASMHDKETGPHKTQFKRNDNYVLLCWVTMDFELYAAFDPLADKSLAIRVCNRVCQWVKDVENEIFLLGGSPFAW